VVPRLIRFAGSATDAEGKALSGTVGITFAIYKDQQGGAPVWMETQNVKLDGSGHYSALLGATKADGLPMDLFTSGEARWVGVQVQEQGQAEQTRVLLLSVPYALKAGDAETVGGLPPSAFVLAAPAAILTTNPSASQGATAQPLAVGTTPVTTAGGTVNKLAKFDAAADITNSQLFDNGTNVGIGNTAPAAKLDVSGTGIFRGLLSLPATGTATATAGTNSQPLNFTASSFKSGTGAVNQVFRWQAEPAGNNTAAASGTLNLLSGTGTAAPTETGLKIAKNGAITFAPGQTFPGAGTVKSVGLSAPASDFTVSGSPVTGSGTLALGWKVAPTSVDTANAIVKRDGTGSFNVTNINGSGTFATATVNARGIFGVTSLDGGFGVNGSAKAAGGTHASFGVVGDAVSTVQFSSGVVGVDGNTSGTGGVTLGVQGHSVNPVGIGVLGFDGFNGPSIEFLSHSGFQQIGVWGDAESGGSVAGIGVVGTSDTGVGVFAENNTGSTNPALLAAGGSAVSSSANNGAPGISATGGTNGCCDSSGIAGTGGAGIVAQGGAGRQQQPFFVGGPGPGGSFTGGTFIQSTGGMCGGNCGGDGIHAAGGLDNNNLNPGLAGVFDGDISVRGKIFAGTKDFKVDHPLDPANKYLLHASVESSEMMNLYTGNVTTDAQGEAIVPLPEWFELLNTDFRYQLTVIGQFAQAIVAREISGHQFAIRTNLPDVKVSWQVTGVRQDAFAKANPLVVEQVKNARERGYYIHPELYGAPEEKQIEWARNPGMMRKLKEMREKQLAASQKPQWTAPMPSVPRRAIPMKPLASTQLGVASQN
jgi:hypothetical protein